MRPFCLPLCLSLCFPLMLAVPATAATTAGATDAAAVPPISPACNVVSIDPAASGEPPAWLLLASAVVLLAAGRLAGSR